MTKREDGTEVKEAVYIGMCEHGKARAIVVDDPRWRKVTAECVAEMVADGLIVKHVSGSEGREAIQFKCVPCDERRNGEKKATEPQQGTLIAG